VSDQRAWGLEVDSRSPLSARRSRSPRGLRAQFAMQSPARAGIVFGSLLPQYLEQLLDDRCG